MRKAEIIDGKVANITLVDPDNIPDWCKDWPEAVGAISIGWEYSGGVFEAPTLSTEEKIEINKSIRDSKLKVYEYDRETILLKSELGTTLTAEEKEILRYSIALREIVFPADGTEPVWPPAPIESKPVSS